MMIRVKQLGQYGLNRDLSQHELPPNVWTDCNNIRFLDGYAWLAFGYSEIYNGVGVTPQHLLPISISGNKYWCILSSATQKAVTYNGTSYVWTDISHVTPRTGVANKWTSCLLNGVPIVNADDGKAPMWWDLNLSNKFVDLPNFTAYYKSCRALRSYRNFLIALAPTMASNQEYLSRVAWSHSADTGTIPSTWDYNDQTKDAGFTDLAGAGDIIVDGMQLRNSFIIYRENSTLRMDFTGSNDIFSFNLIFGMSGVLNKNCIAEFDGWHFVVTNSDILVHDGNSSTSILDKQARRDFFQIFEVDNKNLIFCFKNPFLNEIFVCYPSYGSSSCDKALVYNYVDKTVSYRDVPNLTHANYGDIPSNINNSWNSDNESWGSDLSRWGQNGYTPDKSKVLMASTSNKLFLLDDKAKFDTQTPSFFIERRGLSFDAPEMMKLVKGIRPRFYGIKDSIVTIKVGSSDSPYDEPVYSSINYRVGIDLKADCFVTGRYIAIRFESNTINQLRMDSYDIEVETVGEF